MFTILSGESLNPIPGSVICTQKDKKSSNPRIKCKRFFGPSARSTKGCLKCRQRK